MKPLREFSDRTHRFTARLLRVGGKGDRAFAPLPATVDGGTWRTAVWRDPKSKRSVAPGPMEVRGSEIDGDKVAVERLLNRERFLDLVHPLE